MNDPTNEPLNDWELAALAAFLIALALCVLFTGTRALGQDGAPPTPDTDTEKRRTVYVATNGKQQSALLHELKADWTARKDLPESTRAELAQYAATINARWDFVEHDIYDPHRPAFPKYPQIAIIKNSWEPMDARYFQGIEGAALRYLHWYHSQ